jgi:hypothetical protein
MNWFTECGQCGWAGPSTELKDHPTRPSPMDLGFCPECGCECEYLMTEEEYKALLAQYD